MTAFKYNIKKNLKRNRPENRQHGFTLIEIMLAMAILAVVMSLLYTAYTRTYRNITTTESQAQIYEMARITMLRITEDLESTYVPEKENSETDETGKNTETLIGQNDSIDGRRADRIRFYSKSHIDIAKRAAEAGNAKIAYYPLIKEDDSITLYRSDTAGSLEWPEENTEGWIICEGLYAVTFTYRDKNDQSHDMWDETVMNSEEKLPTIIDITLEFIDKDDPDKPLTLSTSVYMPLAN